MPLFEHQGGALYYERSGPPPTGQTDHDPVVLSHGFSLDHRMWEEQVSFLADNGWPVITYDARGFGQSSPPTEVYRHEKDLHALLGHLSVARTHVVGLSMGGRIAINFALTHPEGVKSLTVMDTALDGYPSAASSGVDRTMNIKRGRRRWLAHPLFRSANNNPLVKPELKAIVDDYSGWHWQHDDPLGPQTDARNRLEEITVPTLVIVGLRDLPEFHDIAEVIHNGVQQSVLSRVGGAGHMVNMERPDTVNDRLLEHLQSAEAAHAA